LYEVLPDSDRKLNKIEEITEGRWERDRASKSPEPVHGVVCAGQK